MKTVFVTLFLMMGAIFGVTAQKKGMSEKEKLLVVWSSGDRDVALKVCLLYTHAAKKMDWFKEVHLIVWGASAQLLAVDEELQAKVAEMKKDGVVLEACVVCANMYGVADDLEEQGIDVKAMGLPLTERLKAGWCQLNF